MRSTDIIDEVRAAMADVGLVTGDALDAATVRLIRFHVHGDRRRTKNGWLRIFADAWPTAKFGSNKTGSEHTWRAGSTATSTAGYFEQVQRARVERGQGELELRATAAKNAEYLWRRAGAPSSSHPYGVRKGISPFGIRQIDARLVIPLRGADGAWRGLQFIAANGSKRFLRGTHKHGAYHAIGRVRDVLIVCEGYATGATLYQALGQAVAVAFDCGNLRPVAEALRSKFHHQQIVIAGDDDRAAPTNPGRVNAEAAARAVDGIATFPPFASLDGGTDWNDFSAVYGIGAVRDAFGELLPEMRRVG